MADINTVAQEFTGFYYKTFDGSRADLAPLYREHSMLTFESAPTQGAQSIVQKLTDLPFQKVQHQVDTLDAQPASQTGNILVLVTGKLLVDDGQSALMFSQTFQLVPEGGSYYVLNDVFRLVYG